MNKKLLHTIVILMSLCLNGVSQVTPGEIQSKSILLVGGTAHLGNGSVIQKSVIGFKKGVINQVADLEKNKIDSLSYDTIINIDGREIYPGFIAMNSTLGLMEIGAVRATKDYRESGKFNPNARTLTSYNTDSRITPTVRSNGVLIGQISPRGGIISGTSSVMRFDAWNWEDAVIKADEGIHLNWPRSRVNQNLSQIEIKKSQKNIQKQKSLLEEFFLKAQAYSKTNNNIIDLKMEAMKSIFNGNKRLYIHADEVQQIKDIISFKNKFKLEKITLVGGQDIHYILELIAENKISVLINRVHSLPHYRQSQLDDSYKLAAKLFEAGILFCFENQGDMEQMQTRNLPFLAGTAVAYGLPYEEAIKALSYNCAQILGLEKYGVLESGKSATLFISNGDALEIMKNKITHAFIDGREIDLSNDQIKNYEKYCEKYGLELKP